MSVSMRKMQLDMSMRSMDYMRTHGIMDAAEYLRSIGYTLPEFVSNSNYIPAKLRNPAIRTLNKIVYAVFGDPLERLSGISGDVRGELE